jgi:hypothetical protein
VPIQLETPDVLREGGLREFAAEAARPPVVETLQREVRGGEGERREGGGVGGGEGRGGRALGRGGGGEWLA